MTDLPPAAQSVINAAVEASGGYGRATPVLHARIAAALRAAADQGKEIDVPFSNIDQWEKIKGSTLSYWTAAQWGYQKAMSELLAIADELEAQ